MKRAEAKKLAASLGRVGRGGLSAILALVGALCGWAGPAQAVTIQTFTPQNEVAVVRQVRAVFSEPMQRLGDRRGEAAFDVSCAVPGQARWVDERNWVYDFERVLPAGTRCVFTAREEIKAIAGSVLTGQKRFEFNTGGPAIVRSIPGRGATIDEEQAFILELSGPIRPEQLDTLVWCQADGIGERIPVRTIGGADRDALVRQYSLRTEHLLILACQRRLPNDAAVSLIWDAGISTPSGIVTKRRQTLPFKVRPTFQAGLSCQRENANAPCTPLGPIRVEFSSPVARAQAESIRLKFPGGERAPEKDSENAQMVDAVTFKAPFPELAEFTVVLPPGLKDADGRSLANASIFPLPSKTGAFPPLAKFATAPFGIIESGPQAAMPVTLRDVERDLLLRGVAPGRPALRELRLQDDAQIIEWFARLRQFHEGELGEDEVRVAFGQTPRRRARGEEERRIETRSIGLLQAMGTAVRLQLPAPSGSMPGGSIPSGSVPGAPARDPAAWPFEVVGVPLPEPGYYVMEIESIRLGEALLGRKASMFVRTSALVTNLSVHFKRSRDNALVWVTTLDTGKVVANADVRVSDCAGKPLWQGRTDKLGIARIGQALPEHSMQCDGNRPGYFVSARGNDANNRPDMSFVWSDWATGIEPWRFNVPTEALDGPAVATHTIFDRTLLRAGETVSMKHVVRQLVAQGLVRPADATLPGRVQIVHEGSGQTVSFDLKWQGAAAETVWRLPAAAKLGQYEVFLEYPEGIGNTAATKTLWAGRRSSGSFRVEAFRLPVFEARLTLPREGLVAPAELPLQMQVNFLNGGAAAALPMSVSALLRPHAPSFEGYQGFQFDREDLRTGDEDDASAPRPASTGTIDRGVYNNRLVVDKLGVTLDANGAGSVVLKPLPTLAVAHRLRTEATFTDPNGEIQTVSNSATLWPASQVVGVRTDGWVASEKSLTARLVVLDTAGQPRNGVKVRVDATLRKTLSHRKRLVGGFYAYENQTEERSLGEVCSGSTDRQGFVTCEIKPSLQAGEAGTLMLVAQAPDASGRNATASVSTWVAERGEYWFEAENHDRIDVLPERRKYMPGDTARLQVRMPFRYATALVAIEREGILDTRVVQLNGRNPVIELPVEASFGPNVYVSVLAVRGRLREVPWYSIFTWGWRSPREWWRERGEYSRLSTPTATVDLAKPAFKLGVAEFSVGVDASRLQVAVSTDRKDYPVRGVAKVEIAVKLPDGKPAPAGTEVVLAAVDEALLELAPNESWNLLESMMQRRSYGVQTATAQMQVVGRRHFGRKAVAAGGDGGRNPTRELFDTLLLWKPRVVLDAQGKATVEVKLNDSLTSFRIVAVADSGPGLFGRGDVSIRATQDLQIIVGLPPLAREGDRFNGMVTLRNTTSTPMRVQFDARAALEGATGLLPPLTQGIELPAGAAHVLSLPVQIPEGLTAMSWTLSATDAARGVSDRVQFRQVIEPVVPVTVQQGTLQAVPGSLVIPMVSPPGALPRRSYVRVSLSASLAGSLDSVQEWFRRYPYTCLEQKTSRVVGLNDANAWAALMEQLPSYLDADGLALYFPARDGDAPAGSEILTAYVLAIAHESGFVIPDGSRTLMLDGLARYVEGRIKRNAWAPRNDSVARKLAGIEALSRYGRATPAMVSALGVDINRLPASALLDWMGILQRMPGLPQRDQRLAQAESSLRARMTLTGSQLLLTQEEQDRWWWLMASGDATAARVLLWATQRAQQDASWREDSPRVLTGLLARMRRGAWETTVANAWGSAAVRGFVGQFESVPVAGATRVALESGSGPAATREQAWSGAGTSPSPSGPSASGSSVPSAMILLPLGEGESTLKLAHAGTGQPWANVQALAAVPLSAAQYAGYRLTRTVAPVQRKVATQWTKGDVVRVQVEFEAAQTATWVVLNDPIPAGATILGTGLGRDSAIASADRPGDAAARNASFEERTFSHARAYYEYLPAGRHRYSYVLRLNQDGEFLLPPTRIEAMYAPELFGESPNARWVVRP